MKMRNPTKKEFEERRLKEYLANKYGQVVMNGNNIIKPFVQKTISTKNGDIMNFEAIMCPLYGELKSKFETLRKKYKSFAKENDMQYKESFTEYTIKIEITNINLIKYAEL